MAFTVDQNVSGAAAFEAGVQNKSSTETNLAGISSLLTLASGMQRSYAANKTTTTQTDRDNTAFNNLLISAKQDRAKGMSEDNLQQKYAAPFANIGLNPEQRGVTSQFFGSDIFVTVKGPKTFDATKIELFEGQELFVRTGQIELQRNLAEQRGENISDAAATMLAVEAFAIDTQEASIGIMQGNRNFSKGFDLNMVTLERYSEAMIASLGVEVDGGNLDLDTLNRLKSGFLELKSQRAFQKPTDKIGMQKWAAMDAKLKSIEATFEALENYDFKNAEALGKQALAAVVLSGDGPYATMAMNNPAIIARIGADASKEVMNSLANASELTPIDYKTLNFDPVVLEFMGVEGSPVVSELEVGTPQEALAAWGTLSAEQKKHSLRLQGFTINNLQPVDLAEPAMSNLFATAITTTAVALTQNDLYSSRDLDVLTSDGTVSKLKALERLGGEYADTAAILRLQIGKALEHNQLIYGLNAAGRVQTLAGISINKDTDQFMLDPSNTDPQIQGIAAVVDLYYGGNFEKLWKKGTSAKEEIRNRLIREGKFSKENDVGYKQFDAATKVLEGPLFRGMAMRYSEFQGIPEQLAKFKAASKRIKVTLSENPAVQTTNFPLSEDAPLLNRFDADNKYNPEFNTEAPVGVSTTKKSYTEDDPYLFEMDLTDDEYQKAFEALPVGSIYIDPRDSNKYTK